MPQQSQSEVAVTTRRPFPELLAVAAQALRRRNGRTHDRGTALDWRHGSCRRSEESRNGHGTSLAAGRDLGDIL